MTTLTRPLNLTQTRQLLTFPQFGYAPTVTAYLWGGGGGAGGADGGNSGGNGTGGGYVRAQFTATPGDTIEITVGSGGWSGNTSGISNKTAEVLFSTQTAVPEGRTTPMPIASATYVSSWSQFLNKNGVWATDSGTDQSHTLSFDQTYSVLFNFPDDYLFSLAAQYQATVYIDGVELYSSGANSWVPSETGGVPFVANIQSGLRSVRIVARASPGASYGIWGVGLTITSTASAGYGGGGLTRTIFNTRTTTASPPLVIPDINILINEGKTGTFSNLMNDYGMWETAPRASTCTRTYNVYFPYNGSYTIQMCAANTATLTIDGNTVYTTPGTTSYNTAYTIDYPVARGYHTVAFTATLTDPTIIGGVAILISKSWSGATGGLAGPKGSSGGGGGAGGATTLTLNPGTINELLLGVAVGGAGGGGAGASTTGRSDANAPGPRGRTEGGISSGQAGQNQGDQYSDGGGGGAGGPGGPDGAGKNGFSSVGDSYGQAGTVGIGYRDLAATLDGTVIDPTTTVAAGSNSEYYYLVGAAGGGASAGQLRGQHGAAVFVFDGYGTQIRDDAIDSNWHDVKTAFVNVNGVWRSAPTVYVFQDNVWRMVVGGAALTFAGQPDDYGILSRPADHRTITPPPTTYDSVPRVSGGGGFSASNSVGTCAATQGAPGCSANGGGGGGGGGSCFTADTLVAMADGTTKNIADVEIGDLVYNYNCTKINRVLFVEKAMDSDLGFLYSPDQRHQPFATFNHPLYINGKLSTTDPEYMYHLYPWFGHTELITTYNTSPPIGIMTYNLWTDGDHTYVVNGYGTTSIVGDGGLLRLMVEQGLMSYERASEVLISFVGMGKHIGYGLYVLNQLSGKLNIKPVNQLSAWVFNDDSRVVAKKIFFGIAKVVGVVACLFGPK
jgi:hypothetical protein